FRVLRVFGPSSGFGMLALRLQHRRCCSCFFFNDTAPTEIYTLSLHDALPIYQLLLVLGITVYRPLNRFRLSGRYRSEEHTSELQSLTNLVCRLLLEKKQK